MKKEYSTPDIVFDSFALNQNIASVNSNCGRNFSGMYSGSCGIPHGPDTVFTITASGCTKKMQDGSFGMCYHLPVLGQNLFNS